MRAMLLALLLCVTNAYAVPDYLHGIWVNEHTFIPPRADGYSGSSYEIKDAWNGWVMADETFSLYDIDYDLYIPNGVFAHLWNPRGEEIPLSLHWLGSNASGFFGGGFACFGIPGGDDNGPKTVIYSTRSGKSAHADGCAAPVGLPEPGSLALLLFLPGLIWLTGRRRTKLQNSHQSRGMPNRRQSWKTAGCGSLQSA